MQGSACQPAPASRLWHTGGVAARLARTATNQSHEHGDAFSDPSAQGLSKERRAEGKTYGGECTLYRVRTPNTDRQGTRTRLTATVIVIVQTRREGSIVITVYCTKYRIQNTYSVSSTAPFEIYRTRRTAFLATPTCVYLHLLPSAALPTTARTNRPLSHTLPCPICSSPPLCLNHSRRCGGCRLGSLAVTT